MGRWLTVALIMTVAVTAGCRGHGPYEASTYGAGKTSLEHTDKVVFADKSLRGKVRMVEMNSLFDQKGRLEVYAEVENRTSKNLVVQIQTQYRDGMGRLSEDATNWRTMVMAPNSSTSYRTVSLNDKAKDYVVRVKLEKRH